MKNMIILIKKIINNKKFKKKPNYKNYKNIE